MWLLLSAVLIGLFAAWLLNVSRPGVWVHGCPEGCAETTDRPPGPLRVMSLNMLHGFPRFEGLGQRLDLIAEEILAQDADIVCLQEVPWRLGHRSGAEYLADQTGLNHLYVRANGNRWAILFEEGEAILSRYPMRDAEHIELAPSAGFFEHRVALRATVVTPWGDLPVTVAHLTNGDPDTNQGQAESLLAFVNETGGGPALVAGDFNAQPDATSQSSESGRSVLPVSLTEQWLDTYQAVAMDEDGFTCCIADLTNSADEPLEKRIDYVFLVPGPGIRVLDTQHAFDQPKPTQGGWQWVSDHIGLLVTLELFDP